MPTCNKRHGPNVSQYLRGLNTVSPEDTTAPTSEDGFNMDGDLALFTNTQFFDFDSGQNTDFQAQAIVIVENATRHSSTSSDVTPSQVEMLNLDFMSGDFNFTNFNALPTPPTNGFLLTAQEFQLLQPKHTPVQIPNKQPQFRRGNARAGQKTKPETLSAAPPLTSASQQMNFEEASRLATEEDKRRRNTAASARFRIKKKQRERALERSTKQMTEQATALESKVAQLETENKWLKNLLVEKSQGSDDITTLWKEFTKYANEKTKAATESSTTGSVKDSR